MIAIDADNAMNETGRSGEFWVRVNLGLGKRLRVLLSAIGSCELTGRRLVICWPVTRGDSGFQARLGDLWTHPYQEVSRLKLVSELKQRVDRFLAAHADRTPRLGIHVRHHQAHPKTQRQSPPSWFEGRIGELRTIYSKAVFFLSCDGQQLSARFCQQFSGLIHEPAQPPAYNSRAGVRKGLVGLHLLGQTDHLLGSHWSSFSEMARCLQANQGNKGYEDSQQRFEALRQVSAGSREALGTTSIRQVTD